MLPTTPEWVGRGQAELLHPMLDDLPSPGKFAVRIEHPDDTMALKRQYYGKTQHYTYALMSALPHALMRVVVCCGSQRIASATERVRGPVRVTTEPERRERLAPSTFSRPFPGSKFRLDEHWHAPPWTFPHEIQFRRGSHSQSSLFAKAAP